MVFRSDYPYTKDQLATGTVAYLYPKIDSTSLEAERFMAQAAREDQPISACGVVFVSEIQAHGQGRFDRGWISEKGGLYYTLIIPYPDIKSETEADIGNRAFGIGNLTRQVLISFAALPIAMKRPNDLLLEGKKLGGILTKVTKVLDVPVLSIGIGINVNQTAFTDDLLLFATSIYRHTGEFLPIPDLIDKLTQALLFSVQTNTWDVQPPDSE